MRNESSTDPVEIERDLNRQSWDLLLDHAHALREALREAVGIARLVTDGTSETERWQRVLDMTAKLPTRRGRRESVGISPDMGWQIWGPEGRKRRLISLWRAGELSERLLRSELAMIGFSQGDIAAALAADPQPAEAGGEVE